MALPRSPRLLPAGDPWDPGSYWHSRADLLVQVGGQTPQRHAAGPRTSDQEAGPLLHSKPGSPADTVKCWSLRRLNPGMCVKCQAVGRAWGGGTWGGGAPRGHARPQLRPGTHRCHLPSRLNGSTLENDAFSDKSEPELVQESEDESQDHSRKTNQSRSDRSEAPGGPPPRGTTYVEQDHEELGEVRAPPQPGYEGSPCTWPPVLRQRCPLEESWKDGQGPRDGGPRDQGSPSQGSQLGQHGSGGG